MDFELTPKLKEWLEKDPSERDLQEGAELLLRVTGNRILFANVTHNIVRSADVIEYHIKKIYQQRLQDITHEEVKQMMVTVDSISETRHLTISESSSKSEFQRGKRTDHDELPEEIQQLYTRNDELRHKMRDVHTKIRLIDHTNSTCPDSDRYPLIKALIAYDKEYRENWNKYDHYIKGTAVTATALAKDERQAEIDLIRFCSLSLGKYQKNPTEKMATRIKETYSKISSPSVTLQKKMADAGLL